MPADETEAAFARQHDLGQFLTPEPVADYMASLFRSCPASISLLDAGAGDGALTAALVRRFCCEHPKPSAVSATAYELDSRLLAPLRATLAACRLQCERAGIAFSAEIHNADFIGAVVPMVRKDLFAPRAPRFNTAILNPPYRKIRSESSTRLLLRSAGIESSNLYAGFLALVVRLLADGAEMVAITPRSFCNGPYFRPFREDFLARMFLRRLRSVAQGQRAQAQRDGCGRRDP